MKNEASSKWIPSYVGIPGNEEVDALAKSALFMSQHSSPLPLRKYKNRIPLDLPRRIDVAFFRMLMGHDYLQRHLNKIGVTASTLCLLFGDDSMNGLHLLICFKLKVVYTEDASHFSLSHLYWIERQRKRRLAHAGRRISMRDLVGLLVRDLVARGPYLAISRQAQMTEIIKQSF
ncbi:hypothetical protein CDAR_201041 [Caerostris darwini]|uniref:RNase H type-1 domain-containing protein n=1 Tax=Caerostris darwini TaxID=1538125 RepID=A0AAV4P491_9ARAC|nr:hypothetical protein CDAR_201041 [Caerostris darwini]